MNQHHRTVNLRFIKKKHQLDIRANCLPNTFELLDQVEEGDWHVSLITKNLNTYALGQMTVKNGKCRKRTDQPSEFESPMEASAVIRLKTVLRGSANETVVRLMPLTTDSEVLWGKIRPLTAAPAADLFLTEFEHSWPLILKQIYTIHVELTGITFKIESIPIEVDGCWVAWRLPTSATRLLRKTAPRIALNWEADVKSLGNGTSIGPLPISDISPLGCGFNTSGFQVHQYEELEITFRPPNLAEIRVHGLVIERSAGGRIGCIFAIGSSSNKQTFLQLLAPHIRSLTLHQKAEDAWDCLDKNGYLDLLKGGELHSAKEGCIDAWRTTDSYPETFQPLATMESLSIGTIAAAQTAKDHWVPHSFATVTDPKFLQVTEVLYQSWPLYLLSQPRPLWMSTWYDADKPWHNRFYQVFINEHLESTDCFSFVRRWYWSPRLPEEIATDTDIEIQPLNHERDNKLVAAWQARYGKSDVPVLRLEGNEHFVFENWQSAIACKGQGIGIINCTSSKKNMNPFGVFNVAHLNLFDAKTKEDLPLILRIVNQIASEFKKKGVFSAAITLDFDCNFDLSRSGFIDFAAIKCMTVSDNGLSSLISNNTLCFADMRIRRSG